MEKKNCMLLLKFSEEESFLDSMFDRGSFYCNTVDFFRRVDNSYQGDRHDSKLNIIQGMDVEIFIKDKKIAKADNIQIYNDCESNSGNILSFYCYETESIPRNVGRHKVFIDDRMLKFGDYVLMIFDIKAFFARLECKMKELKVEYEISPVKYYDSKSYSGVLGIFRKEEKYKYQNEIRLFIKNPTNCPLKFEIGNISDISKKIKTSDLKNLELEWVASNNGN